MSMEDLKLESEVYTGDIDFFVENLIKTAENIEVEKIDDENESNKSFESCLNKDDESEKSFESCSGNINERYEENKVFDDDKQSKFESVEEIIKINTKVDIETIQLDKENDSHEKIELNVKKTDIIKQEIENINLVLNEENTEKTIIIDKQIEIDVNNENLKKLNKNSDNDKKLETVEMKVKYSEFSENPLKTEKWENKSSNEKQINDIKNANINKVLENNDSSEKIFCIKKETIVQDVHQTITSQPDESDDDDDIRPGSCREQASSDEYVSSWDENNDEWVYDPELINNSKDGLRLPKAEIALENQDSCEKDLKAILDTHVKKEKILKLEKDKPVSENEKVDQELIHNEIKETKQKRDSNQRKEVIKDPSVIPTSGKFFMHDLREGVEIVVKDEISKTKQVKKDEGRWKHDMYDPDDYKSLNHDKGNNFNTYPARNNKRNERWRGNVNTKSYYNDFSYDDYYYYCNEDPYYYNSNYYTEHNKSYKYNSRSRYNHQYDLDDHCYYNMESRNDNGYLKEQNYYYKDIRGRNSNYNETARYKTSNRYDDTNKISNQYKDSRNEHFIEEENAKSSNRSDKNNHLKSASKNRVIPNKNVDLQEPDNIHHLSHNNIYSESNSSKKNTTFYKNKQNFEKNYQIRNEMHVENNDKHIESKHIMNDRNLYLNDSKNKKGHQPYVLKKDKYYEENELRKERNSYINSDPRNDSHSNKKDIKKGKSTDDQINETNYRQNFQQNDRNFDKSRVNGNSQTNNQQCFNFLGESKNGKCVSTPLTINKSSYTNVSPKETHQYINEHKGQRYSNDFNFKKDRNADINYQRNGISQSYNDYNDFQNEGETNHYKKDTRHDKLFSNVDSKKRNQNRDNDFDTRSNRQNQDWRREEDCNSSMLRPTRSKYDDIDELKNIKITVDRGEINVRHIKSIVKKNVTSTNTDSGGPNRGRQSGGNECQWDVSDASHELGEEMPPLSDKELLDIEKRNHQSHPFTHHAPPRFSRMNNDRFTSNRGQPIVVPKRYSEVRADATGFNGNILEPVMINLNTVEHTLPPQSSYLPPQMMLNQPSPYYIQPLYLPSRLNQFSPPFVPQSAFPPKTALKSEHERA